MVGLFFSLARCLRFFSAGGSGILISGVRLDVRITSFAVARPQKADGAGTGQLRARPEPFTGKGATSLVVNQTDQVQFVRHCSKLPPDGLPGQKESTVVHERNCAIEATSRTMDSQRTADSVLKRLNRLSHLRGRRRLCRGEHSWSAGWRRFMRNPKASRRSMRMNLGQTAVLASVHQLAAFVSRAS